MDDILSLVYFAANWVQPAIWANLISVKSHALDFTLRVGAVVALASYAPLYVGGFIAANPALNLYYFYAAVGVGLSYLLPWNYTKSLSVSALVVFTASLYWEIPIIVNNAIFRGFEWDWILHGLKLYFAFWLSDEVGWNVDPLGGALLFLGLALSWLWGVMFPIVGAGTTAEWNSLPYLAIRMICTLILFTMLRKEAVA
jgi:hypothetical protein